MSKRLSFSIAVNLLTENFKKGARTVKDSFRSMQMQIITFATALGAGGLGLSGLITRFRTVARETNQVLTALKNVSNGTRGFADSLSFLNGLAKKYGIYVNTLVGNFTKFTASATQANMSIDNQKKVFESVSRATSAFALSTEQTDGVFLALSQMMSKGKISSEELRKQMGEKLPIAMQAMAKAAGVSMGQLEKLLKQGKLMSADIIPKFADALNEMIPNVDTDNLETSLNRLTTTFNKVVNASGFQNKYKALIDGLNSLLQSVSKNIANVIIGVLAVIGFAVANSLAKVYRNYANTGKQIIANEEIASRKMRASAQSYVEAKKRLSDLELQHAQANAQKQIALARRIEEAKLQVQGKAAAARKAIADRATAHENASTIKSNGVWGKLGAMVKGTSKMIGSAVKSMISSFGFGVIIAGITAVIGWFVKLYTETKRVKNIFSEYKKEAERIGDSQEIKTLQTQLAIMNDKTKSQKEVNAAQAALQKMLGKEKLSQGDINKEVAQRIELLKQTAKADFYAQKAVTVEDQNRDLNKDFEKAHRRTDYTGGQSLDDIVDYLEKGGYFEKSGLPSNFMNTFGLKGSSLAGIKNKITEYKQNRDIINDANKEYSSSINNANILTTSTTPTLEEDTDDKALRAAEKRLEALRKLDEEDRTRQIEQQKFDLDIQQKAIDAMDDNIEKRMRQTVLNLEKEKLAIEEHQSKLLKDQQEYAKNKYVSVHGDTKGFEEYFSGLQKTEFKGSDGLSILPEGLKPEDIEVQVQQLLTAAQNAQQKGMADINRELTVFLQEQRVLFASDREKRLAELDNYYDQELKKWKGNAEAIALLEKNRKLETLQVNTDDNLNKLDFQERLEQERMAGLESIGMTDLVEQKKWEITKKYLQLRINALQSLADTGNKDAQQQIQVTQASLDRLDLEKPTKGLKGILDEAVFNTIAKGFENAGDSAEVAGEKTTTVLGGVAKRAQVVADTVSLLQSMFGGLDEGMDQALSTLGGIAQGFATGGIVGGAMAVVSEGIKIFSNIKKANQEHREALRLLQLQREQQQHIYNLTKSQQRLEYEKGVTVFGSDEWGKAINAAQVYDDAIKKLNEQIAGTDAQEAKGSIRSFLNKFFGVSDPQAELKKIYAGLADIDIVTGHKKTGFLGMGKGKDTYSSILDLYPELVEANGKFNKTLAESILSTHKMSDASKQSLQQIIENAELVENAYAEMKNYLTDIFGELGNTIMNTFVEAFKGTQNAMSDLAESVSDMLSDLVTSFIQSIRLGPILEKASAEAEKIMYNDSLSDEEKNRKLIEVTGSLIKNAMSAQGAINEDLKYWGEEIKKQTGVNPFVEKAPSQDSTKGYSTSMDQDTGGAILGRITGIQESILQCISMVSSATIDTAIISRQSVVIGNEQKKQTGIFYEMQQIQIKSYRKLEGINEKMESLDEMKSSLAAINKNTKEL